jgi:hypothetical protein
MNDILKIGAETARIPAKIAGSAVGSPRMIDPSSKSSGEWQAETIQKIGEDTMSVLERSAEFQISRNRVPLLLPDSEEPRTENNPLRRLNGEPVTKRERRP